MIDKLRDLIDSVAHIATPTELTLLERDGSVRVIPQSATYRPLMMDELVKAWHGHWKIAHVPAEILEVEDRRGRPGALLRIARRFLDIPRRGPGGMNDKVLKALLAGENAPKERSKVVERITENLIKLAGPTLVWCSPKGGATFIWLYDGDLARPWGDISPLRITNAGDVVSENLPKRLATLTRPTALFGRVGKVRYIEAAPVYRTNPDGTTSWEIEKVIPLEDVPDEPGVLKVAVYEAPGAIHDGFFFVADRLVRKLISDRILTLSSQGQPVRGLAELEQTGWLWNGRIIMPGRMAKGDVIRMAKDSWFDVAVATDNLKSELETVDGSAWILLDVRHETRRQRKSNRQVLAGGYHWSLKGHVEKALAEKNDRFVSDFSHGVKPKWVEARARAIDDVVDGEASLVRYDEKFERINEVVGDLSFSRTALRSIADRYQAMNAPRERVRFDNSIEVLEDTRKFPIPGTEFRSIKPLSAAIFAGVLTEAEAKTAATLEHGIWMHSKIGILTTTETWRLRVNLLGGGDGDDEALAHHGVAEGSDRFPVACNPENQDEIIAWLDVVPNQIMTLEWRMPVGAPSNGVQTAWEFFCLRPADVELERLAARWGELACFDLANRPHRKDELTYPMEDHHVFTKATFVDISYSEAVAAQMIQAALKVRAIGGVGRRSNLEVLAGQHNIAYDFEMFTEDWTDALTKGIPSDVDLEFIHASNVRLAVRIAETSGLDQVALKRLDAFLYSLGMDSHKLDQGRGLFTALANTHELDFGHVKRLTDMCLEQQYRAMRTILADVPVQLMERRRITRSGYQTTVLEPRLVRAYNTIAADVRGGREKLAGQEFEAIGNGVVDLMNAKGVSHAEQKAFVLEALAWLYIEQDGNDQMLMNGKLLELYAEVLKDLREAHSAFIMNVHQEHITCTAHTHETGCWRSRFADPLVSAKWEAAGRMSYPCWAAAQASAAG